MRVVLDEGAFIPERAYSTDAGMDLRTPVEVTIPAHGSATIDTGVHMAIEPGWFGKLESKSGLNVKHDIVSLGGVIDSNFVGSIRVKLYNMSDMDYHFERGDKIVQIIIQPCGLCAVEVVDSLEDTERGSNGFGSTGR